MPANRPPGGGASPSRTPVALRPPLSGGADSLRGKDVNCAFRARNGRDSFGWAVTNLSPPNAAIDLGCPRIAVGGLP
jgi:hypothetical protein